MTLAEVLLTATLTAVLVVALVSVYGFVITRSMHAFAKGNVVLQAERLTTEVSNLIANSVNCEFIDLSGRQALKCTLPENGRDVNADGRYDEFYPSKIKGLTIEQYKPGQRVWIYFGDPTKDFGSGTGVTICKAVRSDDLIPTAADVDRSWVYYYDRSVSRWNLISQFDVKVDPLEKVTSFTVTAQSQIRAERQPGGGDSNSESYTYKLSRVVSWRYWRP